MPRDTLLGFDIGTTGAKCGAFRLDGRVVFFDQRVYDITHVGQDGTAEQDPALWWEALSDLCHELTGQVDPQRVAAVCVGGQGPTLVPLDAGHRPLADAMLWMDTRAREEAAWISGRIGRTLRPNSPIPQALWLRRHQPDLYNSVCCFIGAWDYLVGRLSGVWRWSLPGYAGLLAAAELDAKFPPEAAGGTVAGNVTPEVARETGLPAGVPVVTGWVDRYQDFLGSGLVVRGRACLAGGTSGSLCALWDPLPPEQAGPSAGYRIGSCQGVGGPVQNSGSAIRWLREQALAQDASIGQLIAEAESVARGADGLLFAPYLVAERYLRVDANVRGVLHGLTLAHSRGHIVRALLEGLTFLFRKAAEQIVAAGVEIGSIRAVGGQAQSDIWNQIKADVLGVPIEVPAVIHSGTLGAAILAAHATGLVSDLAEAAEQMVHVEREFRPDPWAQGQYDAVYQRFLRLEHMIRLPPGPPAKA